MRTLHRIILLSLAISALISTSACVSAKKYRSLEEKVGQLESQLTDKDIDLQRMTAEKLKADSALQAAQTNNPGEDKTNKYTDSDSDGVPDYKDWEPYSPAGAKVDSKGVTVVKPAPKDEEPEAPVADKLPVITFSPYSVQLDKDALETLEQFAASLTKKKFSKLEVIGHASDYNQATKNADLAKRRATTVKDALVDYGVEPTKMTVATKDMADAAAQPGVQAFVAFKFGTGAVTPEKPAVEDKPVKEDKPATPAGKGTYHDVVKGDTLYNISKRYNTTVDNIKRLNNMKDNNVKIGTKIRVQ